MHGLFFSRRRALKLASCGFGALAFSGMLAAEEIKRVSNPLMAKRPHHPARAKRIIFLFMQGGPSQVDTFDYKPVLAKRNGEKMPFDDARVIANTGKRGSEQTLMQSPWKFRQYGECGQPVSELFPHMAQHVDKMCMIHSMHTEGVAHGPATLFLHTGATNFVRPSMGSWISYALGSENDNLPAFVSIAPSPGNGGARNYGNAFLPPVHQGTILGSAGRPATEAKVRNLVNSTLSKSEQLGQFELLRALNAEQTVDKSGDKELEAVISSYELAWRFQNNAPGILDLSRETEATHKLYGMDHKHTVDFGSQCLMARRLAEAGVRYIQVTYGDAGANPAWDQHSNLPKHAEHAKRVDKPVAGLLQDLAQRGLLDDTLVWFGAEFGRTPYSQNNGTGRDHNPNGFTTWLAGAGVKTGFKYGASDEFGHKAVDDKMHMHDLHATLLHLLGVDHKRLTYSYSGRNFRLTDVHGEIATGILT
ncbi:MAG: sulfatase [Planctomycetaceae bacterium]|nr:sulfatase [Planctomycetaceae bacterium]